MSTIISSLNSATDDAVARIEELEDENEELKTQIVDLDKIIDSLSNDIDNLREEIENLRGENSSNIRMSEIPINDEQY